MRNSDKIRLLPTNSGGSLENWFRLCRRAAVKRKSAKATVHLHRRHCNSMSSEVCHRGVLITQKAIAAAENEALIADPLGPEGNCPDHSNSARSNNNIMRKNRLLPRFSGDNGKLRERARPLLKNIDVEHTSISVITYP